MVNTTLSRRRFLATSAGVAIGLGASSGRAERTMESIMRDVGESLWSLPTPALVIDLDAMESNLHRMANFFEARRVNLRPHTKTHKCPIIARKQLDLGAVGVCAAKVSEAEVMVRAGIDNVLITSPVVTKDKIDRVIALAQQSSAIQIVVDQTKTVRDLNEAAAKAGVLLHVLIDLNLGQNRTGIALGNPAVKLAEAIRSSPSLHFGGLQAYAGNVQHEVGFENRQKASRKVISDARETKYLIEKGGSEVPLLSVGGTGTYNIDSEIDGVTDVQAGSYLFMDVNYRGVGGRTGPIYDDFQPSLLVLATAISQPVTGQITIDAGFKAFATDQEPPQPLNIGGVTYRWAGDEHGILTLEEPSRNIRLGDKLLLIASHCDPTVNLYDRYYCVRDERVTEVWPILGRGHSQ